MFHAIKANLPVATKDGEPWLPYYPSRYLRRQVVRWMVNNRQSVMKQKGTVLRSAYGLEGGSDVCPEGRISYETYLINMLTDPKMWGDDACLYALSKLFSLRITILNGKNLEEYRIRHDNPLALVDLVLVFNGKNHYSAVGKWLAFHMSFMY